MAKKILVVGGGGREHAIIKALKKSPDWRRDLVRTGQRRHQLRCQMQEHQGYGRRDHGGLCCRGKV